MALSDITNKVSKKRKELDDFTRGMICGLACLANWKQVDISKTLDISTSTVHSIVKKYKEEGLKGPKPRSGRPLALTNRDGRSLALSVRRSPTDPMGIHSQNLGRTRGVVSLPTIRKKLREKGFSSFKAAKKPFLGLSHRRRRKIWVTLRQHWTMEQWKKAIWSDESRFRLIHNVALYLCLYVVMTVFVFFFTALSWKDGRSLADSNPHWNAMSSVGCQHLSIG